MRKKYPSDISREQFAQIKPLLEGARKKTRPRIMARLPRGEKHLDMALEGITNARTVEQLRQAQSVVLPLRGMSLEETAGVTGLYAGWVSKLRNRFINVRNT